MAIVMQASGSLGVEAGAATITMNEDGSFQLLFEAPGRGMDTLSCQIAAETLGVALEAIIPSGADTDVMPFFSAASASSATLIAGRAVEKAAKKVLEQILIVGGRLLKEDPKDLVGREGSVWASDGRSVSYPHVYLASLEHSLPITATASRISRGKAPIFSARQASQKRIVRSARSRRVS